MRPILDKIIAGLNRKENIGDIAADNLKGLTEEEKTLIKMYHPEKALIVYGSLAPGQTNHHVVEPIKGNWQKGFVRGRLVNMGWGAYLGYKGFIPPTSEVQEQIDAFVFLSDELVANWKTLDEFEGEGYKRILAKYELAKGAIGVGYIYAINEENAGS